MAAKNASPSFYERMLTIDRRWIFALLWVVVVAVYLLDIMVPVYVTAEVRNIYDRIEGLNEGDVILLAQGKVCRTARAYQQLYETLGSAVDIVVDRAGESIRLFYRIG